MPNCQIPWEKLTPLALISNGALSTEGLPQRLKVLNWGDNETASKGVVKVGLKTASELPKNQAKLGFDKVALDYSHNSLQGHPNYQPDPRKVAAYGRPVVIPGDGVYLEDLEYTPSGQQHAKEYADLSPTPLLDEDGEVTFLHSVALCPHGEVKGLSFYAATDPVVGAGRDAFYRELVCKVLGLDPTRAEDSEILAAACALAGIDPEKMYALSLSATVPSPEELKVCKTLGISAADWAASGRKPIALSANQSPQQATEEQVRRMLNISPAAWVKHSL